MYSIQRKVKTKQEMILIHYFEVGLYGFCDLWIVIKNDI